LPTNVIEYDIANLEGAYIRGVAAFLDILPPHKAKAFLEHMVDDAVTGVDVNDANETQEAAHSLALTRAVAEQVIFLKERSLT
jgi:hypothetical protein